MNARARFDIEKWGVATGLILVVSTAWVNVGVIAVDDYWDVLARVVPAGVENWESIIARTGFRNPVTTLLLSSIAHFFAGIGFTSSIGQLRAVLITLGLFSFSMVLWATRQVFQSPRARPWAVLLVCTYFLIPLFLTRSMIESLALPWLTASAAFAIRYWTSGRLGALCLSLMLLGIASVFRAQSGICALALFSLPLLRRKPRDLGWLLLSGFFIFSATGLLDYAIRGVFHQTLRSYLSYNLEFSSTYGRSPFWIYGVAFALLTLPPSFLRRYPKSFWRTEYAPILPSVLYFAVFLASHSLVPHKEERFVIPIIPVLLWLLVPLLVQLDEERRKWRLRYFWCLNFVLIAPVCYSVVQANTVNLCVYLSNKVEVRRVVAVGQTLAFTPHAYVGRKLDWINHWDKFEATCDTLIVRRVDLKSEYEPNPVFWHKIKEFRPGPFEAAAILLNPAQNSRRSTIEAFAPIACQNLVEPQK